MKKLRNLRSVRDKRSYSFRELADTLGVHIRTVQSWHKLGMPIIEDTTYPYLVLGRDAKQFLQKLSESKKTKLTSGQCYCVGCHKAIVPLGVEIRSNNRLMGKRKESVSLIGKCPSCGQSVTRFATKEIRKVSLKPGKFWVDDSLKALPLFGQLLGGD